MGKKLQQKSIERRILNVETDSKGFSQVGFLSYWWLNAIERENIKTIQRNKSKERKLETQEEASKALERSTAIFLMFTQGKKDCLFLLFLFFF